MWFRIRQAAETMYLYNILVHCFYFFIFFLFLFSLLFVAFKFSFFQFQIWLFLPSISTFSHFQSSFSPFISSIQSLYDFFIHIHYISSPSSSFVHQNRYFFKTSSTLPFSLFHDPSPCSLSFPHLLLPREGICCQKEIVLKSAVHCFAGCRVKNSICGHAPKR